ncbi:hypothetical protein [Clostridium psychrophilum]|uniref:hypothetical protein n=1 Tax=Clostridium psychrophilum TaxID=132926 RepID=UPI001C0D9B7C|nr:hypothetical protein [Clostridium psychrophilum]MBU3183093.1 hypothetical protein [Clostridium psychrophilum]
MNLINIIFDIFMKIFPAWLTETIFGAFLKTVNNNIKNKFLKIMIYSTLFILSIIIAFGLVTVVIVFIDLILMSKFT